MVELEHFILHENPRIDEYLVGVYLYRGRLKDSAEIIRTAVMMATEQTTGTWIRVPGETEDMMKKFRGRVLSIWEIPDTEQYGDDTDVSTGISTRFAKRYLTDVTKKIRAFSWDPRRWAMAW